MNIVMRDHLAWTPAGGGSLRAFGSSPQPWWVAVKDDGWEMAGSGNAAPEVFELGPVPSAVPVSLARRLDALGPVVRWRNPDLWDAIATAIIRQVIRADQARHLYRRLCGAYGGQVATPHGSAFTMPGPDVVVDLPPAAFEVLGLAFKRRPLQAAAEAFLSHGGKWNELPPDRLADELQTVPRIGPWTAGAAVADYTHDWTLYPYGDLAVRKWAATAAPDLDWPGSDDAFASHWRRIAGDQLGPLTLFTLAWGGHHGGSP